MSSSTRWTVARVVVAAMMSCVPIAGQSGGQGATGVAPVFRARVDLVQLDVFAADGKGQFVEGLTAADFEVLEDGRPQKIVSCELLGGAASAQPAGPAVEPASARPGTVIASNTPTGPERFYVLILDDVQSDETAAVLAQSAAERFIERYMDDGDIGAVVFASGRDKPAQAFTSDHALLLAAVRRYRIGKQYDVTATTDVLAALSTYLTGMQGSRKTAIFFGRGVVEMRRLTAKDLVGAANRAMLSFFVVDPSGLHDRAGKVAATDVSILQGGTTWTTAAKMKAQDRLDDYRRWLADETGGFAVLNTNDMDRAMSRIKADASQYYLLGYYPATTPKPGSAHTLTVRSRRPGVSVRTRKGYSVPRVAGDKTPYQLSATNVPQTLLQGLEYPARQRSVRFTATASVADGLEGMPPTASVTLVVDARDLALAGKASVDYAVIAVGPDGGVVGHDVRRAEVDIDDTTRARLLQSGLRLESRVTIAPGTCSLRVSVADAATGRAGSLWMDVSVPPG